MLSILIVTTRIFNTIRKTLKLFSNYTVYATGYTFSLPCTFEGSMLRTERCTRFGINYYLLYLKLYEL